MGYNGSREDGRPLSIMDIVTCLGLLAAVVVWAWGMGQAYKRDVIDVYGNAEKTGD